MHGVSLQEMQKLSTHWPYYTETSVHQKQPWHPANKGLGSGPLQALFGATPAPTSISWLEQPSVGDSRAITREERNRDGQGSVLTFRVQSLDL